MNTPVTVPLFQSGSVHIYTSLCLCASVEYVSTSMCMLRVCPCVLVTVGSTLSAAVDISAVVMGALFSSRCRQYHPSVTLHCHIALSKKENTPERNKWREGVNVEER